jgi:hypothetical protein
MEYRGSGGVDVWGVSRNRAYPEGPICLMAIPLDSDYADHTKRVLKLIIYKKLASYPACFVKASSVIRD